MTLFQVVQMIREIAESHSQIQTFGEGDIYNYVDNGGEIKYPVSWAVFQRANSGKGVVVYDFLLIFADLLFEDKSNRLQIQSDCQLVAMDFLSKIKFQPGNEFTIADNVTIEPFEERFDDFTAGVSVPLKISVPFPLDFCSFPSKT